ncbi:MAG TPA: DNA translocase FtsK, partial [Oscillibacter sp.]|nr:DNA translocase FtsK [Oscillibacter sp.]
ASAVLTDKQEDRLRRAEVDAAREEVTREIETGDKPEPPAYEYPPITLLKEGSVTNAAEAGAELRNNSRRLAQTLTSFGVDAQPGDVVRGPSVTRYEFTLSQGVKLSKITNLQDDIALALGASGVRIAPIPNKISVVGVEVPNKLVSPVNIRTVLESREFTQHPSTTAFAVGKDISGRNIVGNISKLPHVLIAGTTGSGKSVCTNSLIVSMLYKSTPEEVRFIMVDPKMVELAPYNGIPHLLIPVVTDPKKAAGALQWAVYEMMKRYKMFSEHNVKDLASYNKVAETDETLKKLPSVIVVIDELADLMLVAAKEVEESICRVAQMGRAAGMHLVIATQRPSADVITGLMKANIPSRIAFAVASAMESRIILDTAGAEKLVGRGDMLYAPLGEGKPKRVQGCFISSEEIERVVNFVKENGETDYDESVIDKINATVAEKEKGGAKGGSAASEQNAADEGDELLPAAIDVVMETGQASVSMLQRRLKLGYSRAARIVDEMETRGIVGQFEGSKPRQILITKEQWQELKMKGAYGLTPPEDGEDAAGGEEN